MSGGGEPEVPEDRTDFAVAAYREEGSWLVARLPTAAARDLESLRGTLRKYPAETGTVGLVSVADDFFVLLRVRGDEVELVLSDATAEEEWPLAREVLDALGLDPDEVDEGVAGDLDLFADMGLSALDLRAICEDVEAYPDELLGQLAERLGFGDDFDRAVDGAL